MTPKQALDRMTKALAAYQPPRKQKQAAGKKGAKRKAT